MGADIPLYVFIVCSFVVLSYSSLFLQFFYLPEKKTKGGKDGTVAWHFIHLKYTYTLNCNNFDSVFALVHQQHCSTTKEYGRRGFLASQIIHVNQEVFP